MVAGPHLTQGLLAPPACTRWHRVRKRRTLQKKAAVCRTPARLVRPGSCLTDQHQKKRRQDHGESTDQDHAYWATTILGPASFVSAGLAPRPPAGGRRELEPLGYPAYFATILGSGRSWARSPWWCRRFPRLKEWAYAGFFFDLRGRGYARLSGRRGRGCRGAAGLSGIGPRVMGASSGQSQAGVPPPPPARGQPAKDREQPRGRPGRTAVLLSGGWVCRRISRAGILLVHTLQQGE